MRNYIYNKRLVFNIDENSDNFDSFKKSVAYIKQYLNVEITKYYAGGWNVSYLYFKDEGIEFELLYRDFGGTELSVNENLPTNEILKAHKLANDIYNIVHNGS